MTQQTIPTRVTAADIQLAAARVGAQEEYVNIGHILHIPAPVRPYITGGSVNLIQIVRDGNPAALTGARQTWGDHAVNQAVVMSKIPVTQAAYNRATATVKSNLRIVEPVDVVTWGQIPESQRWRYYIKGQPVKASVAAGLGKAVLGKTAYYSPSIWESITPWDESKGQTATTARVLQWEAEIAVPFFYVGTHWHELSNAERGLNIVMDALIVGALAGKPTKNILNAATRTILNKNYGRTGYNAITRELKFIKNAVAAHNPQQIKNAGARIESLGRAMKADNIGGAQSLINYGKTIRTNATKIADGVTDIPRHANKINRNIKSFMRSERGSIGKSKYPIPDDEIARSGLTKDELDEIHKQIGDNADKFRKVVEMKRIEKLKKFNRTYETEDIRNPKRPPEKRKPAGEEKPPAADKGDLKTKPETQTKKQVQVKEKTEADKAKEALKEIDQATKTSTERKLDELVKKLQRENTEKKLDDLLRQHSAAEKKVHLAKQAEEIAKRRAARTATKAKEAEEKAAGAEKAAKKAATDRKAARREQIEVAVKEKAQGAPKYKGAPLEKEDKAVRELQQRAREARRIARALAAKAKAAAKVETQTKTATKTATQTKTATKTAAKTAVQVQPLTEVQVQALVAAAVKVAVATKVATKILTKALEKTEIAIKPNIKIAKDGTPVIVPPKKRDIIIVPPPIPPRDVTITPPPPIPPPPPPPPVPPPPPPNRPPPPVPPPPPPPPTRPPPPVKKGGAPPPSITVRKVSGIPANAGVVKLPQGIVMVRVAPPYKKATYRAFKEPVKGRGSPQRGLTVVRGEAPEEIILGMGKTDIIITNGTDVQYRPRRNIKRGRQIMSPSGKLKTQKRGTII